MDKNRASEVVSDILHLSHRIDESIRELMMTGPSGSQFNEYRRSAGRVLGYLFTEFLRPIFVEFPDLEPREVGTGRETDEAPIDRAVAEKIKILMDDVDERLLSLHRVDDQSFKEGVMEVREAVQGVRMFLSKSYPDLADEA